MKKIFFLPILALLMVGCNDDDDNNNVDDIVPISLNSRLVVEPRESRQDTQIARDQQVSFFVTKYNNVNDTLYSNAILTADGIGGFTYNYYGQNTLYYPLDNENVDFYAVHPYAAGMRITENFIFNVRQDQSDIRDFLNSDLLYCKVENVAKSRNSVAMIFRHKLSKITFEIIEGEGTDLTLLNGIEVLGVNSRITLELPDSTLSSPANPVNIIPYGVRAATGTETTIDGISAIVVPQTFTGGNPLFKFTVDNTEFFYTPQNNVVFEQGNRYNYRITINNAGIEVESTIDRWLPGGDTEGEGTIQ